MAQFAGTEAGCAAHTPTQERKILVHCAETNPGHISWTLQNFSRFISAMEISFSPRWYNPSLAPMDWRKIRKWSCQHRPSSPRKICYKTQYQPFFTEKVTLFWVWLEHPGWSLLPWQGWSRVNSRRQPWVHNAQENLHQIQQYNCKYAGPHIITELFG